jgi:type IV secretory pathway VirB4 component
VGFISAKFGSNIIVDFDKRGADKTNANILILGNSGQGKSYLMKLILTCVLESGKSVLCLDPEHEYAELADNLGGAFIDLMSGEFRINPLEPKNWSESGANDDDAPDAFRQSTKLSDATKTSRTGTLTL